MLFLGKIFFLGEVGGTKQPLNVNWSVPNIRFNVDVGLRDTNVTRDMKADVCHWRSSYQEGSIEIPLTDLTPPHCCACPYQVHGFPTSYVMLSEST
jgi:hypothetical protein